MATRTGLILRTNATAICDRPDLPFFGSPDAIPDGCTRELTARHGGGDNCGVSPGLDGPVTASAASRMTYTLLRIPHEA